MILVKLTSHRMHSKLRNILGKLPCWYVQFTSEWPHAYYVKVTEANFDCIKGIKGVRRSRIPESELAECVSWE